MPLSTIFAISGRNHIATLALAGLACGLAMPIAVSGRAEAEQAKAVAPGTAPAKTPPSIGDDAMRVVLVKGGAPDCKTDCAEWISAEGTVLAATPNAFEQVLETLGDRKPPVFISSPGGDADAALKIGRLLREHHLTVAVTHTTFAGCVPTDKACGKDPAFKGYNGTPVSAGTQCASACVVILAGGDKRYVAKDSKVGVHQVAKLIMENISSYKFTKYDISDSIMQIERELVSERLIPRAREHVGNDATIYREQLTPYFTEMGISETIVALMQKTDPTGVHWMTGQELASTHLATSTEPGESLFAHPAVASAGDAVKAQAQRGQIASLDLPEDRALRRSE